MASARLRRAFKYPGDSDQDEPLEGIDEEEQEKLIQNLHTEDEKWSAIYKKAFIALPILLSLAYLPWLFRPSTRSEFLTALLSITSFFSSTYILQYIPLPPPDPKGKRAVTWKPEQSPVDTYLPYLNGLLCSLLAVSSFLGMRSGEVAGAQEWIGMVPSAIYVIILIARQQLVPLDVGELNRLRYPYKGV